MTRASSLILTALFVLGAGAADPGADQPGPALPKGEAHAASEEARPTATTASVDKSLYKLPAVGKPRRRIGGGRRGPAVDLPDVFVLAPDHVGLTISEKPQLYWYLSHPALAEVSFELTLVDEESIRPVVDARLETPLVPGLQKIALADYGVRLLPGQEYQWSVALVVGAAEPSQNVLSSGWIERVPAPEGLDLALADAPREQHAALYGGAGLWYDLLGSLFARLPDESARADLERVLAGAGLPAKAAR